MSEFKNRILTISQVSASASHEGGLGHVVLKSKKARNQLNSSISVAPAPLDARTPAYAFRRDDRERIALERELKRVRQAVDMLQLRVLLIEARITSGGGNG